MPDPELWTHTARRILTQLAEGAQQMTDGTSVLPRPVVLGWHHASHKRLCPRCAYLIRVGDKVAHLDTQPPVHVCKGCAR